jgi:hypothetical protein
MSSKFKIKKPLNNPKKNKYFITVCVTFQNTIIVYFCGEGLVALNKNCNAGVPSASNCLRPMRSSESYCAFRKASE